MSQIFYNGIDVFSGLAPTPFFSRTISMLRFGEKWGQREDITLQGYLTGRCITYQDWVNNQKALLSGWRQDFQALEIVESGNVIFSYPRVSVKDIKFASSNYGNGLIPFSIELEAYPEEYFSGAYGILEPSEVIEFSEEDDGQISVQHTTSAQGFNTSSSAPSNALENARSWVAARTGWNSQVLPAFISGITSGTSLCLQTLSESYDRLNAKYEVQESYIADKFGDASAGLLRYTSDFASGIEDGICTMSVQGELKGCRFQDLASLRDRYKNFNAFSEAVNRFNQVAGRTDLNPIPVTKGVSEDSTNRIISFDFLFNDDSRPKVHIDYTIDFSYDFESDIVSAAINASISSKATYSTTKWNEVISVANSVNLYSLLVPAYNLYVQEVAPHLSAFPLNPVPISTSRSENEFAATISLGASYSNSPVAPPGLDTFSSSLSFTPALHKYAASPILDGQGEYYIFDMGFVSRASLQIDVNGQGSYTNTPSATLDILKSKAASLGADYLAGSRKVLDAQSYVTGNVSFNKQASVNVTYSSEQPEFSLS